MIDCDEKTYPTVLLKAWKMQAEYEQYCKINQLDSLPILNSSLESRRKIACREINEQLSSLHEILY